jgi:hypothetical protein
MRKIAVTKTAEIDSRVCLRIGNGAQKFSATPEREIDGWEERIIARPL